MEKQTVAIDGIHIDVYSLNTVIVGTGCAGFNAADSLYSLGQKDIAIVTEGINMGTSRNTGSDKQTYYKLTMAGSARDSVMDMAETLFEGGCMHGDIALIEAALSSRSFFKLVEIGVPFPHNSYGEYVGYKTDHDPKQRATSAGPLTSRYMTEKLQERVRERKIKIFDEYLVIGILTEKIAYNKEIINNRENNEIDNGVENKSSNSDAENKGSNNDAEKKTIGLIALNLNALENPNMGFTLFNCKNIIYAVGGPAGMYSVSVYPESQTGASGIAFEAGVKGVNLTESQYGIASVKFRWNLSGTYQQVLPRYISTDINGGDEREFLQEYFPDPGKMLDAVFLKGYQWPFDPRKISDYGSSLIDILVYNETQLKGRRVFLDYTRNPSWGSNNGQLKFSTLGPEAFKYLENSGALFGTPIQRLRKMNRPAIELYKNNFIDLEKDYLEIAVCAQHNNGGLIGNIWWESNIRNFFPVGEVNGTFGVYRPGGTALNSTQTGSLRAAQYISVNYRGEPLKVEKFVSIAIEQIRERVRLADDFILNSNISINMKSSLNNSDNRADSCKSDCQNSYPDSNVAEIKKKVQKRMTMAGAHIRSYKEVNTTVEESIQDIISLSSNIKISSLKELPEAFRVRDIIISQYIYLSAIKEYLDKGGKSRGSYLVHDDNGMFPADNLPQIFGFSLDNGELLNVINEIELKRKGNKLEDGFYIVSRWKPVRPIPQSESWFENVWAQYREMSNN